MIIGIDASRANVVERTGTERYAWEVIRGMLPMLTEHQVRLYVRETLLPDWPSMPANVEVCVLRWPPGVLWTHLRLSWELLWRKPDLLFVPADTVPLFHPKKTISTIHDIAFERFPELYRGASVQRRLGWLRPMIHLVVRIFTFGRYSASERDYHRWSVRQAIRACSKILTVSKFSQREIVSLLGVAENRITVTYLGVDQPEYYARISTSERNATLSQLHLVKPFFLYIGRLEKKKNIGTIVRAYEKYVDLTEDPVDLVLVGAPGFGWDEVDTLCTTEKLKDRIHILGWQSHEVVNVLRCTATAILLLSQYEGFGLPALEALSAGVPLVASKHGSLPEVIGTSAVFVDTDDLNSVVAGLQQVVSDDQLRQRLITAGQLHVREFTWESTSRQTLRALLS